MGLTIADLKKGERGVIIDSSSKDIPLKLLEMGCLPGNEVKLLQLAPFYDPLYLNVNGSFLAIRKDTAALILIERIDG
jgi:ferrous iron transport protein A